MLGFMLDNKLSWNKHDIEVANRAEKALMVLRNFARNNWGYNPIILLWMYIEIVIAYAAMAWMKRTNLVIASANLSKVQRLACV